MAAKLLPWVLRLAILLAATQAATALQVTVEQGVLRGAKAKTHAGNVIFAFKGVPFAAPPVNELRFKEPAAPAKWDGIRDATKDNPICIQRDVLFSKSKEIIGQEDCLYLNVFTPKVPARKGDNATGLLPVLVFFHGGGWLCGNAGTYGPNYLLDQDIVLVVPNFRLGPLGFLSTEDEVCPGNFGLKDQVAALRWVRDNIAAFGGNKGAVTIAGESAGGASVHYHMISPMARGLFHHAISMSGTIFAHWAFSPTPMVQTKKLAIAHGCPFDNSADLIACLAKKDAKEIIDKQDRLYEWGMDPILPFRPSIEPFHKGQNYMPASREEMIRETEREMPENSVPWIAGFTSEDGAIKTASLASDPALMAQLERDFLTAGPLTLNFTADNAAALALKIKNFYLGVDGKFVKENFDKITRMFTDRQFVVPLVYSIATMRAHSHHRPIYLYQFGYKGKHSMAKAFDPNSSTDYGVVHMDDLQYIFSMPDFFPAVPKSAEDSDTKMMKYMTKLIADFAFEGYPTPTKITFGEEDENELEWYAIGQVYPLEIANISSPKPEGYLTNTNRFQEAVTFWKSLGLNEDGSKDYIENAARDEL